MPLSELNLYLDPSYFTWWGAYLGPIAIGLIFASTLPYLIHIRKITPPKTTLVKRIVGECAWFLMFGFSLLALFFMVPYMFYDAYTIKHSVFKTEPYITLTQKQIILHEENKNIPWKTIQTIFVAKGARGRNMHVDIKLKNGETIELERKLNESMDDAAKIMNNYLDRKIDIAPRSEGNKTHE
jgi:hypothetical protein